MNIYIPKIDFETINRKSLFVLTRPFFGMNEWENNSPEKSKWKISEEYVYVAKIEEADAFLIPKPIQKYSKKELNKINEECKVHKIKAYGYISGDFGEDFGNFENIIFFRMGGFKSQLSHNNRGFPVSLSDHFERIYQKTAIDVRKKQELPIIGFCGHSDFSLSKKNKEYLKFLRENLKRVVKNPFRKDYEPLFPSAFERARLLQYFEQSNNVKTNFIYRKHYRGGAVNEEQREKTTLEYYDNIATSDYVLCVRGAGNFSVRFYETLLMGRIPIFVNTDCLLPFEDKINWKEHVVWVEWKDRNNIANIVADFHNKLTDTQFEDLQKSNRQLWKEGLSVNAILEYIKNDI